MPSITVTLDTDDLVGVQDEPNAHSILRALLITAWGTYQSQRGAQLNAEVASSLTDTCEAVDDGLTKMSEQVLRLERHVSEQNRQVSTAIQTLTSRVLQESGKSVVKGSILEKELVDVLTEHLPEHGIEHTGSVKNSGDILITHKTFKVLIDAKNYTRTVEKSEVDKLKRDMEKKEVTCGAVISTAPVRAFGNRDLHFYTDTAGKQCVIGVLGSLRDTAPIPMLVYFLEAVFQKMIESPCDVNQTYREETNEKFTELLSELTKLKSLETQFEPVVKTIQAQLDGFRSSMRIQIQNILKTVSPSTVEEMKELPFLCECGRRFERQAGLSIHKAKCSMKAT